MTRSSLSIQLSVEWGVCCTEELEGWVAAPALRPVLRPWATPRMLHVDCEGKPQLGMPILMGGLDRMLCKCLLSPVMLPLMIA